MRRAARFLLYTLRPYLLILPTAATGAALLLPRIAGGTDGPAAALCNALPGFGLLFLLMLGMNLALSALPLALSLGGRRRDYFWALQPVLALYVGTSWAIQLLMSAVPKALRWTDPWGWDLSLLGGWPLWVYPLVCWTVLAFGTLCGLLMVESRVWRGIVVALAAMVMTAALIFLMVMAAGPKIPLWGDLPYILGGVLAVVLAVSEFFLWRRITRFSVR